MNDNIPLGSFRTCQRMGSGLILSVAALMALHAAPAAASCGGVTTVTDQTTFNAALATFNAVTTSPCVFTISVGNDIGLTEWNDPRFDPTVTFNGLQPIDNHTPGISLIIQGNGHAVAAVPPNPAQPDLYDMRPFAIRADTTVTMNDLIIRKGLVIHTNHPGFGPGGGIQNYGKLTLNRSTVEENTALVRGGGIANFGILTINQSTIANNHMIDTGGLGGGIHGETGGSFITITNSTISGNDRAAINLSGGNLGLDSVTVKNNEYGLYVPAGTTPVTVDLKNSVLAGNGASLPDSNCYFPNRGSAGMVLNDGGHNLVWSGNATCGIVAGDNGNLDEQDLLGPLADNGGPTKTHAPLFNSPVLDAGATGLVVDQRGQPRPLGSAPDIGAFEDVQCLGLTTWPASNEKEWGDVIECFNSRTTAGTYTIKITDGIGLTTSSPVINNTHAGVELVIDGAGSNGHKVIEGNPNLGIDTRLLEIAEGTNVTVNQLDMEFGYAVSAGGSVLNHGNLTLRGVSIHRSIAQFGAGVYNASNGALVIENSVIWNSGYTESNPPILENGVVFNLGTLTLRNSTISGNKGTSFGGIISNGGSLSLDSVTAVNNTGSDVSAAIGTTVPDINNSILGNIICADSPSSASHNLAQVAATGCFSNGVNDNIVGQDPLLAPLANDTHALLPGSPALDTGATSLTTDQRGHLRPFGTADDRGAYEVTQSGKLTITKHTNPSVTTDFDFRMTGDRLTAPIDFQLDDDDTYVIDSVPSTKTFVLEAGQYTVTEAVSSSQMGPRLISCADANGPVGSFSGNSLTIDVKQDADINCAFFNEQWMTVTATAPGGFGTVSCSPDQVWKGDSSTCTAVPQAGFRVKEWTGDCAGAGANTQCFLNKIAKYQSSTVVFEGIPLGTYTVTANVVQGTGTVSCSPTSVKSGGTSTCTAIPGPGYQIGSWGGDCASWGSSNQCYLTKIKKDMTSTVDFKSNPVNDNDMDGVPDDGSDHCPNTPTGAAVDKNGCSIEQLCSCDQAGNHGQYVSCVAQTTNAFVSAGLINVRDKGNIVSEAAKSQCGK